ncbi:MAG: ROK family protein [Pseudomonadota bacterium]
MSSQNPMFGGIDAGGTTFKCGVSDLDGNLLQKHRVSVTTPEETLSNCAVFFREASGGQTLQSLGIASFGPIDVDPASPGYGSILNTPKPGWAGTDLKAFFADALGVQPVVDTDVNGALLAEVTRGAAKGAQSAAYITVGTGVGAGIFVNGAFAGRPTHPEFGHIPVRRHSDDLAFDGVCPFHGDCLEGMASVTAMRARWGEPKDLPADHMGWAVMADYLAQAARVLTLTLRLEKIVLGGGLMLAPHLLGLVRAAHDAQMADYLGAQAIPGAALIDTPALGDDAGLIGALLLTTKED